MSKLEARQIKWSTAAVEDGALSIELTGSGSKDWKRRFVGVLALLAHGHGEWGEVRLTKRGIRVIAVHPGSESDLRHFLESLVMQANSDLPPDPSEHDIDQEAERSQKEAEAHMTATFRAFAGQSS